MQKVVFLDRDGTINVDDGYVNEKEHWRWPGGAIEGMKMLQEAGFVLVVVTNQSGIGHGLYTEEAMQHLHEYMQSQLAEHGVELAAIAFCPHRRDSTCDCRKPKIGMAKQIEKKIGPIDYANSWMIGDKLADLGFGKTAGTQMALIRSHYWTEGDLPEDSPDLIVDSLYDAAEKITTHKA